MKWLTQEEVRRVCAELETAGGRGRTYQPLRRIVWRLLIGAGLRINEACTLNRSDVVLSEYPTITIRRQNSKSGRPRTIVVQDIGLDREMRRWDEHVSMPNREPFIVGLSSHTRGKRLSVRQLDRYWNQCVSCLGRERARQLPTHAGRHTFATTCLNAGVMPLSELRDVLGHSSVMITDAYLHSLQSEKCSIYDEEF